MKQVNINEYWNLKYTIESSISWNEMKAVKGNNKFK